MYFTLRRDLNKLNISLKDYGLKDYFTDEVDGLDGLHLARVSEQHREIYKLICESGELEARISGKFAFNVKDQMEYPAVGDWVLIDIIDERTGVIQQLLPRKSVLARQVAGTEKSGQIIASNIDTVFICMSLNADFNLRRIERYLTIAWDSMATPVIVLTKSDLCDDIDEKLNEIEDITIGIDLVVCSSETGEGYDDIGRYVKPGDTIAFIGSSGVGKSSIINHLMGEEVLKTSGIREDDSKGRHTTTHRQLLLLPNGGVVIDTPGMRELQIHTGNTSRAFEDIEELATKCKFSDCSHDREPNCAVRAAIEEGILSEERFENYLKLQRETSYSNLNSRQLENEKIDKMFGSRKNMKQMMKHIKDKNKR